MKSLISILSYFIILFVIRKFRIGKIDHINQQTSCPNCRSSAKRISKNQIDKIKSYESIIDKIQTNTYSEE